MHAVKDQGPSGLKLLKQRNSTNPHLIKALNASHSSPPKNPARRGMGNITERAKVESSVSPSPPAGTSQVINSLQQYTRAYHHMSAVSFNSKSGTKKISPKNFNSQSTVVQVSRLVSMGPDEDTHPALNKPRKSRQQRLEKQGLKNIESPQTKATLEQVPRLHQICPIDQRQVTGHSSVPKLPMSFPTEMEDPMLTEMTANMEPLDEDCLDDIGSIGSQREDMGVRTMKPNSNLKRLFKKSNDSTGDKQATSALFTKVDPSKLAALYQSTQKDKSSYRQRPQPQGGSLPINSEGSEQNLNQNNKMNLKQNSPKRQASTFNQGMPKKSQLSLERKEASKKIEAKRSNIAAYTFQSSLQMRNTEGLGHPQPSNLSSSVRKDLPSRERGLGEGSKLGSRIGESHKTPGKFKKISAMGSSLKKTSALGQGQSQNKYALNQSTLSVNSQKGAASFVQKHQQSVTTPNQGSLRNVLGAASQTKARVGIHQNQPEMHTIDGLESRQMVSSPLKGKVRNPEVVHTTKTIIGTKKTKKPKVERSQQRGQRHVSQLMHNAMMRQPSANKLKDDSYGHRAFNSKSPSKKSLQLHNILNSLQQKASIAGANSSVKKRNVANTAHGTDQKNSTSKSSSLIRNFIHQSVAVPGHQHTKSYRAIAQMPQSTISSSGGPALISAKAQPVAQSTIQPQSQLSMKNAHVNPYIQIRPQKTAAQQQSFNKEKGSSFTEQDDKRSKKKTEKVIELSPVQVERQGAGTSLAFSSPDIKQKSLRQKPEGGGSFHNKYLKPVPAEIVKPSEPAQAPDQEADQAYNPVITERSEQNTLQRRKKSERGLAQDKTVPQEKKSPTKAKRFINQYISQFSSNKSIEKPPTEKKKPVSPKEQPQWEPESRSPSLSKSGSKKQSIKMFLNKPKESVSSQSSQALRPRKETKYMEISLEPKDQQPPDTVSINLSSQPPAQIHTQAASEQKMVLDFDNPYSDNFDLEGAPAEDGGSVQINEDAHQPALFLKEETKEEESPVRPPLEITNEDFPMPVARFLRLFRGKLLADELAELEGPDTKYKTIFFAGTVPGRTKEDLDMMKEIIEDKEKTFKDKRAEQGNDEGNGEYQGNPAFDNVEGYYQVSIGDHIAYRYEVVRILGKGSFAQVVQAIDHQSKNKEMLAVKITRNTEMDHKFAHKEAQYLNYIMQEDPADKHNIVRMVDQCYFRDHHCFVFELLHTDLFEHLKATAFVGFSTDKIRDYAMQILKGLVFLEKHKIIHCDLKPENILCVDTMCQQLKIVDFGSGCFRDEQIYTYVQSRFYRSPEVILRIKYSEKVDIWSLGCILAELYTGEPLFPGNNEQEQLELIMELCGMPPESMIDKSRKKDYYFDTDYSPFLIEDEDLGILRIPSTRTLKEAIPCENPAFLDFIQKCLEIDPETRFSACAAMEHPWIKSATEDKNRQERRSAKPKQRASLFDNDSTQQKEFREREGDGAKEIVAEQSPERDLLVSRKKQDQLNKEGFGIKLNNVKSNKPKDISALLMAEPPSLAEGETPQQDEQSLAPQIIDQLYHSKQEGPKQTSIIPDIDFTNKYVKLQGQQPKGRQLSQLEQISQFDEEPNRDSPAKKTNNFFQPSQ